MRKIIGLIVDHVKLKDMRKIIGLIVDHVKLKDMRKIIGLIADQVKHNKKLYIRNFGSLYNKQYN
jgi:RNA binding exosome subunit